MLSPSKDQRQVGRITLMIAAILFFSASSTLMMNEHVQAAFRGLKSKIAFASNLEDGNCTYQTTLTSYITAYNTTTLTQITYLTSTTLIPVSSTVLVPTSTTLTKTEVLTTTQKSVITTLSTATLTSTAFTNVTNTHTVTTSAAQTTVRTTETATETSTTYMHVLSTSTLTQLATLTSSAQVTQTITILTNPVAEAAIALLVLAALATLLVPRIRARRFTSKVCPHCGYSNPPYAHSFCIKCGNPLEAHKTYGTIGTR